LLVIAYDKGKEVGVFDIENQEVKFVPPTSTSPQQSAIPAKPASALDRVRSRMDSNKGVAEGDMYGDAEVSWEKGGRRAPTGAFRNPNFGNILQKSVNKHNKALVKTKKDVGSRIADIGAGGKEHNEKTDAAWDAAKKKVAESYKKK
jgi:hypothetical protein